MVNIRVLKKSDKRDNFSCKEIEIDYFFQKFAGQNQFKHFIGTTYIATDEENILGFITLSSGSLDKNSLPKDIQKKLPLYPLPILHISRIGVDSRYQNKGIGKMLMLLAFRLAVEQKEKFGSIGIRVDAKDKAIKFYETLGFVELEVEEGLHKSYTPTSMFLPMQTIQKVLKCT